MSASRPAVNRAVTAAPRIRRRWALARPRRGAAAARLPTLLVPLLVVGVAGVAMLAPATSFNTVPVDVVNAMFVLVGIAFIVRTRADMRLPLGGSYFLILIGGILSATQSIVPEESAVTLAQDTYLFVWFVIVVNFLLHRPRITRVVAGAWAMVGVGVAVVVWVAALRYPSIPVLFGTTLTDAYGRSQGLFRDPNMAGSYIVLSLFVLWAAPRPRNLVIKSILTVPCLFAIYHTQSLTAFAAVIGGVLVAVTIRFIASRQAAAATTLIVMAAALVLVVVAPRDLTQRSSLITEEVGATETFEASLGRTASSLGTRAQRWEEAFRLFGSHIFIGIGPSSSDASLEARGATVRGELHNDYIAGFIERGMLGGFGNLLLFAIATVWAFRVARDRALRDAGWRPAALAGGMVGLLMSALSLETLHFRHAWLFLALLIALGLLQAGDPAPAAPRRPRGPDLRTRSGYPARRRATTWSASGT